MRSLLLAFTVTIVLASATALLLSSCRFLGGERVEGNGKIATRQLSPGNFNSIDAGGALELHIRQDASPSVRIETDENLQEFIEAYTDGSTLVIKTKQGYNLDPSKDVLVYVSAPTYKDLEISGASKMFSDAPVSSNELELHASGASEINMEVNASRLRAELSGASTLQLKGTSAKVETEASGASHVRCMDLSTDETTLSLSGASNAEVSANKQLNIEASGASDVRYRGNANINQKSSGASNVEKVS